MNMKISQYMITHERSKARLEKEVQSRINEGWEPQCGVSISGVGSGIVSYC